MRHGQQLPDSELEPCGTRAAYRRHLRRGDPVDEACRQAEARAWHDRVASGAVSRRGPTRVHLEGPGACYREGVITTPDPAKVTCLHCLGGYRRLPWALKAAQPGGRSRAA